MISNEQDPSQPDGALRQSKAVDPRANYLEDVSVLRARVLLKMQSLGLVQDPLWMYFYIDDDKPDDISPAPKKDALVHFKTSITQVDQREFRRPFIRLITSEPFDTEKGIEYLTTDVTVDEQGYAQYAMGPLLVSPEGKPKPPAVVPIFGLEEGKLKRANMGSMTYIVSVSDTHDGIETNFLPFGHPGLLNDRIYALGMANRLFDLIKDGTPDWVSNPTQPS